MSTELTEHVNLLHDGLTEFMRDRAVDIGRGCMVGTGLLPERPMQAGISVQSRLLVVSGLFDLIRGLPFEDVSPPQGTLVAGLLQSNALETKFTHLGMISRGVAFDLLRKANPPLQLEESDILKLSRSINRAGPQDLSASSAEWLYQKVVTQTLT